MLTTKTLRGVLAPLLALAVIAAATLATAHFASAFDFKAPTKLALTMGGSTQLEVEWLHVSGAPAYMIEVKANSTTLAVMTGNNTAVLKPLKRNTTYSIRVAVAADTSTKARRMSGWSSSKQIKTSNNVLNAPSDLAVTKATSSMATLTWKAPEGVLPTDRFSVTYARDSGLKKSPKTALTSDDTPSINLTNMAPNTNFYVRVKTVDSAGEVRSDTSDFGLVKSRAQVGAIVGTVSGASPGSVAVTAYNSSGDAVDQADVASSGSFKLTVRPGKYTVLASFMGTGDTSSLWAKTDSPGVPVRAEATTITVTEATVTNLANSIRLSAGGKSTGVITDSSDGRPVRDVDVTALMAGEVVARGSSGTTGAFTLNGLAPGTYSIRMKYRGAAGTGVGFKSRTVTQKITSGSSANLGEQSLTLASWAKENKPSVSGTKQVGKTVRRGGSSFVASYFPLERATSWRYQWYRSGKAISGATKSSYKLTKSDRGRSITVRVTYYHIGFPTKSVSSKSYRVS